MLFAHEGFFLLKSDRCDRGDPRGVVSISNHVLQVVAIEDRAAMHTGKCVHILRWRADLVPARIANAQLEMGIGSNEPLDRSDDCRRTSTAPALTGARKGHRFSGLIIVLGIEKVWISITPTLICGQSEYIESAFAAEALLQPQNGYTFNSRNALLLTKAEVSFQ
jgi:hypothetical protein